ncbi:SDR family oxidoreductase [soil metagenome]
MTDSAPSSSVSRRIALVTGAGSGIGRAVALGLLQDGFTVVLAGRRPEALEEVVALARAAGQQAIAVPTDVRDAASVEALFERVRSEFGRLDVLFNNAGIGAPPVPIDELPIEKWRDVVDTNITGMFLCARAAFGLMRRQMPQGGRIVNNGSLSAHVPRVFSTPYTASKHAVAGMNKSIALDGRAFNIVATQLDVGNALTPLTTRMTKGVPQPNGSTLVEPTIDARHVADAVRYIVGLPLDATVLEMTVMASSMPYVGRG